MFEGQSRKRGHSPDEQDSKTGSNNFQNLQQQRPNPRFAKRPRGDNYRDKFVPPTIEEKILQLGRLDIENHQIGVVAASIKPAQDDNETEGAAKIVETICKCIVSYPTRSPQYATLIGLISLKNYPIGCQVTNALHASYSVYLEAQKWNEALTIIKTLSCLVNNNVIKGQSILEQFQALFEAANQEGYPQARSDYLIYTILSSLSYVAPSIEKEEGFETLFDNINTYLGKRVKTHMNSIRPWQSSSTLLMDYLDSLRVQIQNFKANNWTDSFTSKPHTEKDWKDSLFRSLVPQTYSVVTLPSHSQNHFYPQPTIIFRLFSDDTMDGSKPILGSDKIERFNIQNFIKDIISEYHTSPRICAWQLARMQNVGKYAVKHMIIENILGELFSLPKPEHHEIVYFSILRELIRVYPNTIEGSDTHNGLKMDVVLVKAIEILFDNLDTMNVTVFDRYVRWFTFHLNETAFIFPWKRWSDNLEKAESTRKVIFVQEVLSRSMRFSYHKKMLTLIESLDKYLAPEPAISYKPIFAYHPNAEELAATIKKLIVEKADLKTFNEILNLEIESCEKSEGYESKTETNEEKLVKLDIFTSIILTLASKSLTHLSSAIGKYKTVFKALVKVDGGYLQLLRTTRSVLETHDHLLVILIDKFLKAEFLIDDAVISWILSDDMKSTFKTCLPFELLFNILSRQITKYKSSVNVKKETPEDQEEMEVESGDPLRDIFVSLFQKLSYIVASCDEDVKQWIYGRMQQIYYTHFEDTKFYVDDLRRAIQDKLSADEIVTLLPQLCQ